MRQGDAKPQPGLLACRLTAGVTQPELAGRAGTVRETLARLERLRRRARPETVEGLAKALELSPRGLTTAS
jgi:transcriptional regulator with XRE-family HTH domain